MSVAGRRLDLGVPQQVAVWRAKRQSPVAERIETEQTSHSPPDQRRGNGEGNVDRPHAQGIAQSWPELR